MFLISEHEIQQPQNLVLSEIATMHVCAEKWPIVMKFVIKCYILMILCIFFHKVVSVYQKQQIMAQIKGKQLSLQLLNNGL